jgi:nicotinate-nucleotide pyrophosphorylase (carboxylating)
LKYSPKRELKRFLDEDVGNGDITSKLLEKKKITSRIITREKTVVAGTKFAKELFSFKKCKVKINKKDGCVAKANQTILIINGNAKDVLTCERTVLNLLSRMCGIATQTNNLKKQIKQTGSKSKLFATRKTAPGLRFFDKEAVKIGGGEKHRMTLNEMIMIKDNHLAVEKSIESILRKAKKTRGKIEIEVETQRDAILCAQMGADIIMLDNFSPEQINKTIKKLTELQLRKKVVLEASGRINSKNIVKYAKTNVDMISIGSITNSVDGIDLSLEIS